MNNLWYDHPVKLIYEKFTLWYNGGMRTEMNKNENLKVAVIESCNISWDERIYMIYIN